MKQRKRTATKDEEDEDEEPTEEDEVDAYLVSERIPDGSPEYEEYVRGKVAEKLRVEKQCKALRDFREKHTADITDLSALTVKEAGEQIPILSMFPHTPHRASSDTYHVRSPVPKRR